MELDDTTDKQSTINGRMNAERVNSTCHLFSWYQRQCQVKQYNIEPTSSCKWKIIQYALVRYSLTDTANWAG